MYAVASSIMFVAMNTKDCVVTTVLVESAVAISSVSRDARAGAISILGADKWCTRDGFPLLSVLVWQAATRERLDDSTKMQFVRYQLQSKRMKYKSFIYPLFPTLGRNYFILAREIVDNHSHRDRCRMQINTERLMHEYDFPADIKVHFTPGVSTTITVHVMRECNLIPTGDCPPEYEKYLRWIPAYACRDATYYDYVNGGAMQRSVLVYLARELLMRRGRATGCTQKDNEILAMRRPHTFSHQDMHFLSQANRLETRNAQFSYWDWDLIEYAQAYC